MPEAVPTRSGYVAILGRPNVGKSTLMNRVLAEKISIVSFKPQTTRNRILGILSTATFQMLFLDTPGVHGRKAAGIDGFMLDQAWSAAGDADVVLFLTEAESPRELDRAILDRAAQLAAPKVAAINKIDAMRDRKRLLPKIEALAAEGFAEIVPISATKGEGVADLVGLLAGLLPEGPRYYEDDQLTDSTMRFVAAEIIREKIFYAAREEIPYSIAVAIEEYKDRPDGSAYIHAVIWVEKDSQKGIVIGKGGAMLKKIGEQARAEIETLQQGRVFLRLHVVVKKNWTKDPAALRDLGYKV